MRLGPRLLGSHLAPVIVVTAALGTTLFGLVRMTQLSQQLDERELGALVGEGSLHQAAWALDLAFRAAPAACGNGNGPAVHDEIVSTSSLLRRRLAETPNASPDIRAACGEYVALADRVLLGDTCANVRAPANERVRTDLDARLTTVWVDRLALLHSAARDRDEEVARVGSRATWIGLLLAGSALLLALVLARRLADEISRPMADLSRIAQRLGRGDFGHRVQTEGPREIESLAEELERMRLKLAELETLKQGFLASVSHELRTPLSKIREALALLSDGAAGPLEERQRRVVGIARAACEREVRLVATLLDFSRLRAGTPLQWQAGASIDEVILTAVEDERADARARKVEVRLEQEGDAPRTALDPAMLERAIANLVRNAVSVSPAGGNVRVQRRVIRRENRPLAEVRVSDDGPGVPNDIRETIFHPFVTSAVAHSPKSVGVGLGLALAREVALAHGGDLTLDDTAERGASFVLSVPLESPIPQRTSRPPPPPAGAHA